MPDLSFSIFRIPVRIQLWFLAMVVILAGWFDFHDPASIFVFAGIVFVSILAHELGHAFMGRAFGLQPSITIHGFGGLTSWTSGRNVGAGRSLLISLAGPAVGLVLGLPLVFVHADALPAKAAELLSAAVFVNVGWSIFNLMPIVPLDGGNALRSLWALTKIGDADLVARVVSIPVALTLAALFMKGHPNLYMALFMMIYVVQNVTGIRTRLLVRGDEAVQKRIMEHYPTWLATNDGDAMIREGTHARSVAKTPHLVAYATEIVAMGQCVQGDARSALATLGAMPRGFSPSLDVALHVLDAAGEHAAALELLRRAAESSRDPELLRRLEEARARMP